MPDSGSCARVIAPKQIETQRKTSSALRHNAGKR